MLPCLLYTSLDQLIEEKTGITTMVAEDPLTAVAPMLLPTITYGFAIIYSFGKQGLLTRILGFQLFDIYGFWGLLLGCLLYTSRCV